MQIDHLESTSLNKNQYEKGMQVI